jgi:hypothetical protein
MSRTLTRVEESKDRRSDSIHDVHKYKVNKYAMIRERTVGKGQRMANIAQWHESPSFCVPPDPDLIMAGSSVNSILIELPVQAVFIPSITIFTCISRYKMTSSNHE